MEIEDKIRLYIYIFIFIDPWSFTSDMFKQKPPLTSYR